MKQKKTTFVDTPMIEPGQTLNNSILQRIPESERRIVLSRSEYIHVDPEDTFVDRGKPVQSVFFPETGLISMVAFVDGQPVEVATVGVEGMSGVPLVLGETETSGKVFCQIPGAGRNIPAADFVENILPACPQLTVLCLKYAAFVFEQTAQNSACNRVHSIEERCAKWLLLSHDRCDGDRIDLTQKFLAQMLGVRRQSVSLAAGMLQTAGIVRYSRGHIQVLNRQGLEEIACGCYSVIRNALNKFLAL